LLGFEAVNHRQYLSVFFAFCRIVEVVSDGIDARTAAYPGLLIIDTQFENGYVLIIFEHAAPLFFLEKEIAPDLLGKVRAIEMEQFYSVLCIHSFFS